MSKEIFWKVRKIILEKGIVALFNKVLRSILRKILKIEIMIIFEFKLNNKSPKIVGKIPIVTRFATVEDIDYINYEDYGFYKNDKKYLDERMRNGDKCLLSIWENRIVGYGWIMKNEMELSQYTHIYLPEKKVYTYKGYVVKEFRGKRVIGVNDMEKINYFKKEKIKKRQNKSSILG